MDFQSFLANGQVSIAFGTAYEALSEGFKAIRCHDIDKAAGAFALYLDGIELLFDDSRLCLIQYEIARMEAIRMGDNIITGQTTIQDFKTYLDDLHISYAERNQDDQQLLLTAHNVKVYFENGVFSAALKSW